ARLNRSNEALAAWDRLFKGFEASDSPTVQRLIAVSLLRKGATLVELNRPEEAVEAWDEVVQRFAASARQMLRSMAETALLNKAALDLASGRAETAIATVNRVLALNIVGLPVRPWRGHLIRAKAHLAQGNTAICAQDVEDLLMILPLLGGLREEALDGLCGLAVDLGFEQMHDLITASPAAELLLPLTTALGKEMGLELRVAKEVEDVAEDIRRELKQRQERRGSDRLPVGACPERRGGAASSG
ncbi:MAG: hypothetical protein OXF98_09150, partial [Rhodospirillaceae bacterium]|nr:hypothetical protein [Rhodospirillaceae bacterium]